ncbi:MAG: hypothetical protein MJZ34_00880 [Paludibacteraceae bacterium]|nr:hypothetical protein [Paludibacteraceae bacterium]
MKEKSVKNGEKRNLADYLHADFFMCKCQKSVINEDWHEYEAIVRDLDEQLSRMPLLYEQENMGFRAMVYAHYFGGATDVFVTECSGDDAFGYVILNGDYENSELGYVSIKELTKIDMLNLDFFWEPCPLNEALLEVDSEYFS